MFIHFTRNIIGDTFVDRFILNCGSHIFFKKRLPRTNFVTALAFLFLIRSSFLKVTKTTVKCRIVEFLARSHYTLLSNLP